MIKHQVHSNAFAFLPEYGQSDCGFSHLETSNIAMWEHRTFDSEVLDVTKFTNLRGFRCHKIY
jgi:hypothetical protein